MGCACGAGRVRHADADELKGVREQDRGDARDGARSKATCVGLRLRGGHEEGLRLVVCHEVDRGVGEDAEEGGGVALEEAADAMLAVDERHGAERAAPCTRVLLEVGVGGLEEDLDAVEGRDDRLGHAARDAACEPGAEDIL